MHLGLRCRISLIAGAAALVAGLVIVAIASFLIDGNLRRDLDKTLDGNVTNLIEQYDTAGRVFDQDQALPYGIDRDHDIAMISPDLAPDGTSADGEIGYVSARLRLVEMNAFAEQLAVDKVVTVRLTDTWRAATKPYQDPSGATWLVTYGRELGTVSSRVSVLRKALALAALVSAGLVTAITWLVTGLSLRPVERLRSQAAAISGESLDERVTEPRGNDEIARLARTFNAFIGRVQSSRDAQMQFVSEASHELRNPVAGVVAQLETGLRSASGDEWPEIAHTALADARRVERIVGSLLLLARADERAVAVSPGPVDLDDVAFHATAATPGRADIAVTTTDLPTVTAFADADHVAQIAANMLTNAIRHAQSHVAISVDVDLGDGHADARAILRVDDDGHGVAVADREHIFDRFVRLDDARELDRSGNGLGLAVSRVLAERNGGSLTVTTSALGGAQFVLQLPVYVTCGP